MGRGASVFFNVVSAIFLVLTLLVLIIVLSVAGGTMDAPFLAPEDTQPPPTLAQPPTLTPSPLPGAALTATAAATAESGQ